MIADFAYMLRDVDGSVQVVHDRHEFGVFPRGVWIELLHAAGFTGAEVIPFPHSDVEEGLEVFLGRAG